ncbi:chaperonin [Pseudalgibacter alginicilyticus]|uniref:Chaperonin n=1 Tax=Pseudalgibacter alginicilyticus TaxID=1736674 RepID=A0A0P0CHH4_9FLAO|nr:head GIN domain-containing protein [Pseudalgibacter alginicilyticus]ALJ05618.1 chaperonin [Pseudalgibacter alginicilyticus]
MKRLITSFIFLVSIVVCAQNSVERSIGDFNELKVYDLINVELVKSNENKVVINGENTEDVQINNKNGILKIKMNLEEAFDGAKTKVILYYKSVDIIDVNEGSKVTSNDVIQQFEIALKAQEGASIIVDVDVTFASIKSVTGGQIKAKGKAKKQSISLLTGGVYNGEFLDTENTEVDIKAAGEAHIKATKQADIKIKAGGNVYIYGKPQSVNESRVLGGRVTYID